MLNSANRKPRARLSTLSKFFTRRKFVLRLKLSKSIPKPPGILDFNTARATAPAREFFPLEKVIIRGRILQYLKRLPPVGRILSAAAAHTPAAIQVLIPIRTIHIQTALKLLTTACRTVVMILQRRGATLGTAPTAATEIMITAAVPHSAERSLRRGTISDALATIH